MGNFEKEIKDIQTLNIEEVQELRESFDQKNMKQWIKILLHTGY